MSESKSETAFLRQIILLEDSDEGRELDQRIAQVQREQGCVNRAAALMALLTALGMAALGYGVFLHDNFFYELTFVLKPICEFGLASLICLLAFLFLSFTRERKLKALRAQCRRLATRVMDSRLRKPQSQSWAALSSHAVPQFFRTRD